MRHLIKLLNEMKALGLISDYAIGGATALIYYFEPIQTQDIDVFIVLRSDDSLLVNLTPVYSFLAERGIETEREYLMISGIPVQLLVPYNDLIEEAVKHAAPVNYADEKVRLPELEYLMAIMVQTGRGKDKSRLEDILHHPELYNHQKFLEILDKFQLTAKWLEISKWIQVR